MNLDKKALGGFIKEVEDSRARQKGETEFQRDVFKRAREKHFDVKALRIVLQRRAMDASKRDEQDYNVHAYELALGAKKDAVEAMEQGASAREAAKAHKLPRAAVAVLKAGTKNGISEPPYDADGVIIEDGTDSRAAGGMDVQEGGQPPSAEPVPSAGAVGGADAPTLIVCLVDGRGPCPNTCALEGRCVWASKPAPTVEDGAVAEPSSAQRVANTVTHVSTDFTAAPTFIDDLNIPPFLRAKVAA